MTIWTYTNGENGPRWSADGVAVDLLTDGTFRVEGLTDVYDTLAQAKDRATRWRGILADAIAGDVKGQAEVLATAAKEKGHAERTLGVTVWQEPWQLPIKWMGGTWQLDIPPAYPEAEWHGGR